MAHGAVPTETEYLRARAQVARVLVREGDLHWADAIAFTVWPTGDMTVAERLVNRNTTASRAFSTRLNA